MSILVTGASGFLGRAVVERLCARSVPQVRCFVRPSSNRSGLDELQLEYPNSKIEYLVGNLISPADCRRAVDGVTTIFHLAAQMRGAPASIFLNTVVASNRIVEAMLGSGPKRVVLVSSLAVYGPMDGDLRPMLNEATVLERCPQKRDVYSQAKLWQETLFGKLPATKGYEVIVLRPGIIYGEGGQEFSPRIGLKVGNCLWRFGRNNRLPLSYVQNCAEALVVAGLKPGATGCYNVIDDDVPTASEYLNEYRQRVGDIRSIWVPWWLTKALSNAVEAYSRFSHGQVPAALTPYKSAVLWRGSEFDNSKLKSLGWRQLVPTTESLQVTFEYLKRNKQTMTSLCASSESASIAAPIVRCDAKT